MSRQWHTFTHLSEPAGTSSTATQTRLLSGAGDRYDYWRIAWHVFKRHPLAGVGAGNYTASYCQERRTTESIQNPHSIELQTLSELGVVGALLLATFVAGVALGASRLRRLARTSSFERTLMVAATGAFTVWLVDTSGDWMHLLPGVAAVGLAAAAVLCRVHVDAGEAGIASTQTGRISVRTFAGAAAAFVLVVGGATLLRSEFVQRGVVSAQTALRHDPASAIVDAQQALRLDGANDPSVSQLMANPAGGLPSHS